MLRRVLTERLMTVTEGMISEEERGFREGRECTDKIIAINMTVEKLGR